MTDNFHKHYFGLFFIFDFIYFIIIFLQLDAKKILNTLNLA